MRYLVDGHNLIPNIGLRLDAVDDELELIEILVKFSRESRATIEVFFDGAPAGQAGSRHFGRVTATFVSQMSSADAAIRQRLNKLGADARNWTVASSDREVLQAAKGARAQAITSEELVSIVRSKRSSSETTKRGSPASRGERGVTEAEVQHWLEVFRQRKK